MDGELIDLGSYHPSGWDFDSPLADELERTGSLRRLTPDEVASLRNGGSVPNQIPQQGFPDVKAFLHEQGNFYLYFWRQGFMGPIRARSLQFQRFEVLYPEQAARLVAALQIPEKANAFDVVAVHQDDFFDAYQKMGALVSAGDPNVAMMPKQDQPRTFTI